MGPLNVFVISSITCQILYNMFSAFPGVLEGLGISGRLIGSISTYPGTFKCPWSRLIAKNPPGGIFHRLPLEKIRLWHRMKAEGNTRRTYAGKPKSSSLPRRNEAQPNVDRGFGLGMPKWFRGRILRLSGRNWRGYLDYHVCFMSVSNGEQRAASM